MQVAALKQGDEGVVRELEVRQGEVLKGAWLLIKRWERSRKPAQVDAGVIEVERVEVREVGCVDELAKRVVADRLAAQVKARGAREEERGAGELAEAVGGEPL